MSRAMTTVVREGSRLAWYRDAADAPGFWDRHWEQNKPVYVRNLTLPSWYRGVMQDVLPRDGLIVEAGCGNGVVVRALRDRGYDIEGLDFAPRTIEANRAVDPDGRYMVGDVRAMPYDDGSLGGVISLGVVEHFSDADRSVILRETARCLRPGGVAVLSVPYFSPLRRVRASVGGFRHRDRACGSFYQFAFSRRDFSEQIERAGLRVERCDAYGVRKGVKDTLGSGPVFRVVFGTNEHDRALLDHPVRPLRMFAGHMLLVVARRPSGGSL
ncbi:MAG: hypothetical protein Tsb0013_17230 [Phycisphaerales bacterium]